MDAGKEISSVPQELVQFIKTGSRFIVAGHKEPDGDCVGSQLALQSVLLRLGKKVVVCSEGPLNRTELKNYSKYFIEIPPEDEKSEGFERLSKFSEGPDLKVIVVDCTGMDRTGSLQKLLEKLPCAVIDHHAAATHPPSTPEAPVYVDANAPSCTLLIEKIITALDLELTTEEATLLLFGLCTDTGFFRHLTEKNAVVFEAAAKMVRYGANPKKVYNSMSGGKNLKSRLLLGNILSRTEAHFNGRLLISNETLEDFNNYGLESRDSDALYKMLLSIDGVEAVIIIRQECVDSCTVSLRSVDKIDVSQIAANFGGGGHMNASGFTMKENITYIKQQLLEYFKNILL